MINNMFSFERTAQSLSFESASISDEKT